MVKFAISQFLFFLVSTETYSYFFFFLESTHAVFSQRESLKVIYANHSVSLLNTRGQAGNR